jgi:hypothetical protein
MPGRASLLDIQIERTPNSVWLSNRVVAQAALRARSRFRTFGANCSPAASSGLRLSVEVPSVCCERIVGKSGSQACTTVMSESALRRGAEPSHQRFAKRARRSSLGAAVFAGERVDAAVEQSGRFEAMDRDCCRRRRPRRCSDRQCGRCVRSGLFLWADVGRWTFRVRSVGASLAGEGSTVFSRRRNCRSSRQRLRFRAADRK